MASGQGPPPPPVRSSHSAIPSIAPPRASSGVAPGRSQSQPPQEEGFHPEFPPEALRGKYKFVRYLGAGSYGHVGEAQRLSDGRTVAIKKFFDMFHNRIDAKRILRELRILRLLSNNREGGPHPHIVELLDILEPTEPLSQFNALYVVFEYVDTDLKKLIRSPQFLPIELIRSLFYHLLLAVEFVHSSQLVHRDIKPANLLVDLHSQTLKLCDFGLARGIDDDGVAAGDSKDQEKRRRAGASSAGGRRKVKKMRRDMTTHVITRWYRAPEVCLAVKNYTAAVDMWSCGCILAELLGMQRESIPAYRERHPLFPGRYSFPLSHSDLHYANDQLEVILEVIGSPSSEDVQEVAGDDAEKFQLVMTLPPSSAENFAQRFPGAPSEALDLLRRLLVFNPRKRLTVEDALAHPFLVDVRQRVLERRYHPLEFEFEDKDMSRAAIREYVIQEIAFYNAELRTQLLRDHHWNPEEEFFDGGVARAAHEEEVARLEAHRARIQAERNAHQRHLKHAASVQRQHFRNIRRVIDRVGGALGGGGSSAGGSRSARDARSRSQERSPSQRTPHRAAASQDVGAMGFSSAVNGRMRSSSSKSSKNKHGHSRSVAVPHSAR